MALIEGLEGSGKPLLDTSDSSVIADNARACLRRYICPIDGLAVAMCFFWAVIQTVTLVTVPAAMDGDQITRSGLWKQIGRRNVIASQIFGTAA